MERLRPRHGVVVLLVAAVVVLAVLLLDPAGSEPGDAPTGAGTGAGTGTGTGTGTGAASPSSSAEPPPPSPPERTATVEEYCAAFADFAVANSEALSDPAAVGELEESAGALLAVGAPEDMSDTAWAGQQVVVSDTLGGFVSPTASPYSPAGAVDEFNRYLGATCPLA